MNTRFEKVKKWMKENELQALLVSDPHDLFYLTGQQVSCGELLVTQEQTQFFVDGRYKEQAESSGLEIKDLKELENFLKGLQIPYGFDGAFVSYEKGYKWLAASPNGKSLSSPIQQLRMVKEKDEIEKMKKSVALALRGVDKILGILNEGISEIEVATELEYFWKKNGGQGISFEPIIAFGAGTSRPHYRAGSNRLKKGDLILLDIGVMREHYASDLTRVFSFGKPNPELAKIYEIVFEAKKRGIEKARAGVPLGEVDKACRDYITQAGYGENFVHGTGHGIGLEVHELPYVRSGITTPLTEGMVITIEPGIYLPGQGGVRLEDMVLITKNSAEVLTQGFNSPTLVTL